MCIKEEEDKQSQEEDQTNICKLSLSLIINFVWKCVKLIHHSVIASYIYSMAIALNDLVDNHDIFFFLLKDLWIMTTFTILCLG